MAENSSFRSTWCHAICMSERVRKATPKINLTRIYFVPHRRPSLVCSLMNFMPETLDLFIAPCIPMYKENRSFFLCTRISVAVRPDHWSYVHKEIPRWESQKNSHTFVDHILIGELNAQEAYQSLRERLACSRTARKRVCLAREPKESRDLSQAWQGPEFFQCQVSSRI